jgi:hypothetical protein
MTLNLMLTSRNAVYLSGDFRLTHCDTGEFTNNLDTQKLIPVIRFGWGALIAYTGIANAPAPFCDTGDWVSAQTDLDSIPMNGSIDELPKRLLTADAWLTKISGDTSLAFSIVGFLGRKPFMMLVSNFLDLDGHMTHPRSRLEVFRRKPKQPEVRIAGDKNAVQADEIEQLRLLLRQNADYQVIRENLAQVNARASQRSVFISKECVTGYLIPSGAAEIGPHGIGDQVRYLPGFVRRDLKEDGIVGFAPKYDEHGNPLPPRWVGMTARIQGGQSGDAIVGVIHAFRNASEPLSDGVARKGRAAFWKIATQDDVDAKSFTFTVSRPPRQRK